MSVVTFHTHARDPLGYTCRLLRKAVQLGSRVSVTGEPARLHELDVALWTFAPQEFLPHCWDSSSAAMRTVSPIVLHANGQTAPAVAPVLLHLGGALPEPLQRTGQEGGLLGQFGKIIEVVGQGDDALREARQRWRTYLAQGHTVQHHTVTT